MGVCLIEYYTFHSLVEFNFLAYVLKVNTFCYACHCICKCCVFNMYIKIACLSFCCPYANLPSHEHCFLLSHQHALLHAQQPSALSPSCQPTPFLPPSLPVYLLNACLPATFQCACMPCLLENLPPTQSEDKWNQFNLQAPCVPCMGQAFRYSPENAFYVFNQQIYFIIWHLLDRASLI